jgi:chromosome segregation ATPase
MKPEIQRIFTKLAEERVKLSTKKVELSSLQDMKKKSNDLISSRKQLEKLESKLDKLAAKKRNILEEFDKLSADAKSAIKSSYSEINEAKKVMSKASSSAKELGIDPFDIDAFGLLDASVDVLDEQIFVTESILKQS